MAESFRPKALIFSGHAVKQMFARGINMEDVRAVLAEHETVARYPDDTPYPSRLVLGLVAGRPLHLVIAFDQARDTGYIITVYEPDPQLWKEDFKQRRVP